MRQSLVKGRAVRRRDMRGAAAVEFALLLVPLLLIVFGIVSYGVMLSFRQTMSQAATEGARAAAVQLDGTKRTTEATAAINDALSTLKVGNQTLKCGQAHVTCTVTGPTACGTSTCMTVKVSYPYRAHPVIPTVPLVDKILPEQLTYSATVRVS